MENVIELTNADIQAAIDKMIENHPEIIEEYNKRFKQA